jgi:hypothetical protein
MGVRCNGRIDIISLAGSGRVVVLFNVISRCQIWVDEAAVAHSGSSPEVSALWQLYDDRNC